MQDKVNSARRLLCNRQGIKGMLGLIWFVGGALLVISPMIVGLVLTMVKDLPMIVYMIVGYLILMAIDFVICTAILHLPLQVSMILSVVFPFLQTGVAISAVGSLAGGK